MWRILACLIVLLAMPAKASPIVADISTYRIAIDASFNGIRLFLFGARNDVGDVVIVVRGPEKQFTVRRKERVAGVWINQYQQKFLGVPDFYAVATTKPLDQFSADALRGRLKIGEDTLLHSATAPGSSQAKDFSEALLQYQQKRRLYNALPLSFMGETLFKTTIPFPDTISGGTYTAEIYLISDGKLVGMQTLPIRVEKSGLDAAVYNLAHQWPFLYGLLAITLALSAGWLANRVFSQQ